MSREEKLNSERMIGPARKTNLIYNGLGAIGRPARWLMVVKRGTLLNRGEAIARALARTAAGQPPDHPSPKRVAFERSSRGDRHVRAFYERPLQPLLVRWRARLDHQ